MRWIVDEVDDLISAGVIPAESGAALRSHYEKKLSQEESGGRMILLSVLGATLIGAGIILLIAHNWDDLGRPARTVLSLLPLLASLAIAFWTLLRRADSVAWREGAGMAQCAGVAASVALVSQTYHIEGSLSDFLFIWMLLTLPVPYLLRAVVPALVYIAGIAVWSGSTTNIFGSQQHSADAYWLFLFGILPFYALAVRHDRLGKAVAWLSAVLGVSVMFGLGFTILKGSNGLWIPAYSGLFGLFYLFGALVFTERRYNPLRVLGALGTGYLAVLLTFKDVWLHAFSWSNVHWLVWVLAVGLPCASFVLLAWVIQRKADYNYFVVPLPILVVLAYWSVATFLQGADATAIMLFAIIFNLYAFALALGTAFRGLQQRAFATLNGGLLILVALIISRFVDSDFSIVARGIAFVVLGCLMLGANFWLLKTKREVNA